MKKNEKDTRAKSAQAAIPLIEHVSLKGDETKADIEALCAMARGEVNTREAAAVCVYSEHVALARYFLTKSAVKVATVVNFPGGDRDAATVGRETRAAIEAGAQEIDLVTPYMLSDKDEIFAVWNACLQECAARKIPAKLTLETGAQSWKREQLWLAWTCLQALRKGFDFLRTSTGMVPDGKGGFKSGGGVTPEALEMLLRAVRCYGDEGDRRTKGVVVAGGVHTLDDAAFYLERVSDADHPISTRTVRLNSSKILPSAREAMALT
jgi:deoxyribose-phosphate aldolase